MHDRLLDMNWPYGLTLEPYTTIAYHIQQFPTFWGSYAAMNPRSNITEAQVGGRLIPRSVLDLDPSSLIATLRGISELGVVVSGVSLNVSRSPVSYNSVNPAWRDAAISVVLGTYVTQVLETARVECHN